MKQQTARNVFTTGDTGSVGRILIKAFVANGDRVTFQYFSQTDLATEIKNFYNIEAFQIDFSQHFHLPENNFSVVINNAGVNITDCSSHEVPFAAWNYCLNINLTAPFQIAQFCLPYMLEKGSGRIINISSIYGLRSVEGNLPYTVS